MPLVYTLVGRHRELNVSIASITVEGNSDYRLNIEDLRYSNGNVDVNKVYNVVQQPPTFPGGDAALLKYVATHIKYPESAIKDSIQGVVSLRFVVEADGSVGEVQIAKRLQEDCDKEAV